MSLKFRISAWSFRSMVRGWLPGRPEIWGRKILLARRPSPQMQLKPGILWHLWQLPFSCFRPKPPSRSDKNRNIAGCDTVAHEIVEGGWLTISDQVLFRSHSGQFLRSLLRRSVARRKTAWHWHPGCKCRKEDLEVDELMTSFHDTGPSKQDPRFLMPEHIFISTSIQPNVCGNIDMAEKCREYFLGVEEWKTPLSNYI